MKKKFISAIIALVLIITPAVLTIPTNAAEAITQTLDIASLNKNSSGVGYTWKNLDGVFTMNNFRLETDDSLGLSLPEKSTIVLNGDNYIKASDCAIRSVSELTIEGSGTLTIISGNTGIMCASDSELDTLRLRSGTIKITAEGNAVFSEYATVSFSGANAVISAKKHAVRAKNIQITGGTLDFSGKISAVSALTLKGVNLTASASEPVLSAGTKIEISKADIFCGNGLDSLAAASEYNGSLAIKLKSTISNTRTGILFDGKFPVFVDYIVFISLGLIAIAVIAVPICIKSKKTKKLVAEHEKMLQSKKPKRK